jgi:hypothetical protein
MKWDDDILEENDVFISQWNCKSTNDTGKDVQQLSSTVELVGLMNQSIEAFVDCLSDHLSPWNELLFIVRNFVSEFNK